jgi:hypothetical protein
MIELTINYLEPRGSLLAGTMRALLAAGPVAVATLWTHEYGFRTGLPADEAGVKGCRVDGNDLLGRVFSGG